jgi:hypothetical protein
MFNVRVKFKVLRGANIKECCFGAFDICRLLYVEVGVVQRVPFKRWYLFMLHNIPQANLNVRING